MTVLIVHILDCGGAFYDDGRVDFTENWIIMFQIIQTDEEIW